MQGSVGTLTIGDPDDPKSLKVAVTSWSMTILKPRPAVEPIAFPMCGEFTTAITYERFEAPKYPVPNFDDSILSMMQLPARLVESTGTEPSPLPLIAEQHAKALKAITDRINRSIFAACVAPLIREAMEDIVRELDCRRWLLRGGPLASWYRGRQGFRLANMMDTTRN